MNKKRENKRKFANYKNCNCKEKLGNYCLTCVRVRYKKLSKQHARYCTHRTNGIANIMSVIGIIQVYCSYKKHCSSILSLRPLGTMVCKCFVHQASLWANCIGWFLSGFTVTISKIVNLSCALVCWCSNQCVAKKDLVDFVLNVLLCSEMRTLIFLEVLPT